MKLPKSGVYCPVKILNSEETCAAMCRSVNGGGVDTPDGWDDVYEMFFAALDYMNK